MSGGVSWKTAADVKLGTFFIEKKHIPLDLSTSPANSFQIKVYNLEGFPTFLGPIAGLKQFSVDLSTPGLMGGECFCYIF